MATKSTTVTTAEAVASMTEKQQAALTARIAKDRDAGLSGNDLRERYGAWLTGPARRKLFRKFGHDGLIARSYDGYRDGDTRKGSAHARYHGIRGEERLAAEAKPAAKKRTRKAAK